MCGGTSKGAYDWNFPSCLAQVAVSAQGLWALADLLALCAFPATVLRDDWSRLPQATTQRAFSDIPQLTWKAMANSPGADSSGGSFGLMATRMDDLLATCGIGEKRLKKKSQ